MRNTTILLAVMVMLAGVAQAEVVLYEPFHYDTGDLNGKSGSHESGYADTTTWGTHYSHGLVVGSSLSYSGFTFAGGTAFSSDGNRAENGGSGGSVARAVNTTVANLMDFGEDRTCYISMLIRSNLKRNQGNHSRFRTTSDNLFGPGIYDQDLYLYTPGGFVKSFDNLTQGETYFVVIKIVAKKTAGAGTDTGYIIVYANNSTVPKDEPAAGWTSKTFDDSDAVAKFEVSTDGNGCPANYSAFDEVRVGESWSDVTVVPEPATMALMGLGGLGVLLRRRRRS